ncbi:hypothetical protein QQS21_012796 [Conoideocrella luteorostrata]|uniref:25S rRNA (uridine-N(3))-methyltransferase BMT5-like domain-containing protein n=1 Tax=Conoideocrella luteorostrata TaxID=1105319 RepID=A0AAJ0FM08_9HYPO|nr:hypothetical protein QQS21_012796 [Conoideocrella luteorostrata]
MAKRRKLQRQNVKAQQPKPKLRAPNNTSAKDDARKQQQQPQSKKRQQHHQHERPVIPFEPDDRILLIGEADLSFAASIIDYHGCANVTATVLEKDHAELVAKYPSVDDNIAVIMGTENDNRLAERKPAEQINQEDDGNDNDDNDNHDDNDDGEDEEEDNEEAEQMKTDTETSTKVAIPKKKMRPLRANNTLIYNIDATKLPNSITRPPHNHIFFNFPHVGGKSTDVNRQVRYNQELLVSFFGSAMRALAPGGSIVVTLFEGEPYTLWNIRDLGRHAGLQVEKSFRFQAAAYPGYKHARTLGVVKNKKGEVGGGWKGEERASRSYVFRRKGEVPPVTTKKRAREEDSSNED